MIHHISLGSDEKSRQKRTRALIVTGKIKYGGNRMLKIYGTLSCASGKRMKTANRVFFQTEAEAIAANFRPCAHCMPEHYKAWKLNIEY